MARYTITTRSILYETYEVEAESEAQVKEIYDSKEWFSYSVMSTDTEDTEIYDITPNEEQD